MNALRVLPAAALAALLALPAAAFAQAGPKSVVSTERVRAELMAHAPEGVAPGKSVWVGLQVAHQPEWHTYWKNSGDSGLPTQLQWTLPKGVTAGDIAWPVPKKIPIGNLANYGYEGTVLLPVPLTIAPDFKPSVLGGDIEVKLKASWLVCKKECIPEEGDFTIKLPAKSTTALNSAAFQAAFDAQPQALKGESNAAIDGNAIKLTVSGLPAALRGKTLEFFPETGEVIETAAQWTQAWQGDDWTARVPLSPQRAQSPGVMPIVLALDGKGWRTEAKVQGEWPAVAAVTGMSPALEAALRANQAGGGGPAAAPAPATSTLTLAAALLGALLGGLILNLMPCVFPILAIKVVGFTRHADDRRSHRIAGLAYIGRRDRLVRRAGRADARVARGRRATGLGLPAAVARRRGGARRAVHADRVEPGGPVPVRLVPAVQCRGAGSATPGCQRLPLGRARRGGGVALHGALHGRIARLRDRPARGRGAARVRRHRRRHGPALLRGQLGAGRRAAAAAARRLDGDFPPADGLSDVRHRGVAGLGAGPAKRHRRRGRTAGAAGGA